MPGQGNDHGNDFEKRLEAAELRLANAIVQLESSLDKQSSSATGLEVGLADEISRLQSENVELKSIVGQTSHRLDATIVKLKDHMNVQATAPTEGQV